MLLPFFLPLDLDVTARAAIYEGYNDNVIETRPEVSVGSERRGAPFTGVDVSVGASNADIDNSWSVSLGGRAQHYTPLSGQLVGGNDGVASAGWTAGFQIGQVTHVSAGQSVTLSDQNTARLADMPLLTLDPSVGRQTFVFASNNFTWRRDLSSQERLRVNVSGGFRYMLDDTTPDAPRRGVDYAGPRIDSEWARDLTSRDTGAIRLSLGMWHMPRALLDLSGRRGKSQTWQVLPAVVWRRALSEAWTSEVVGGLSFGSTTNEVETTTSVAPALRGQLDFLEDDRFAVLSYGLGINTDNISFGPGLSHSLGGQYGGALGRTTAGRKFMAAGAARLARASIPTSDQTSFVALTAAAGGILGYALSDWLGVVLGYEGQYLNMRQAGVEQSAMTEFYRNVIYVGLSGNVSTLPSAPPVDIRSRPPR